MLSVEADQDNDMLFCATPDTVRFVGTDGATVSDVEPPLKVSGQVF